MWVGLRIGWAGLVGLAATFGAGALSAASLVDGDCRSTAQGCPATARSFVETGVASWYGPGFHGRPTASGEIYDQTAMTAAHPTLPLGTMVRVVRLDTGRAVEVEINDRGPYIDGRIIDLSRRAAGRLDMREEGIVAVRVTLLDEPRIIIADNDAQPAALVGTDRDPWPGPEPVLVAETPEPVEEDDVIEVAEEEPEGDGAPWSVTP